MNELNVKLTIIKCYSLADIPNIINKKIAQGKPMKWSEIRHEIETLVSGYASHHKLPDIVRDEITELFFKYTEL